MKALFLISLLFLGACAHSVHEVHTSDFTPSAPIESGTMVKAYSEQFVVFYFTGNTDYVDQAYYKLMDACPGGAVSGITTQYTTSLGFFSWTNKILMQGLCLKPLAKKN
ncbi:hypothetical protein ACES2L_07925 [Bdellovibrio bacteriovorus]